MFVGNNQKRLDPSRPNIIKDKTYLFSLKIVNIYKYLCSSRKEYVLSRQVLRSGTSIGANIHEAIGAQSRKDFISKMQISYKETLETQYWLQLLIDSNYLESQEGKSVLEDCEEIKKILSSILKSSKE